MVDKMSDELRRLTLLFEKFFKKSSEKLPKEKPNDEMPEADDAIPERKKRKKNGSGRSALSAL